MSRRAHKRRQGETKNARFWYFWNGGFVKLTLREGQTVEIGRSEPTDEGYSYATDEFSHEGDRVLLRWETGGRDCDGQTSSRGRSAAAIDKLAVKAHEPTVYEGDLRDGTVSSAGLMTPDWREAGRTRCRDAFAESMNY